MISEKERVQPGWGGWKPFRRGAGGAGMGLDLGGDLLDLNEDDLDLGSMGLEEADSETVVLNPRPSKLFLGKFSSAVCFKLLQDHGILEHLENKGYANTRLVLDVDDPFVHKMCLYEYENTKHPLFQVFVRRPTILDPEAIKVPKVVEDCGGAVAMMKRVLPQNIRCFRIEWMLLQDVRSSFGSATPFPGQNYPGLGCARKLSQFLFEMAADLRNDAVLNVPEYFHNACIYTPPFQFIHPLAAAFFLSVVGDLKADIAQRGLAAVSWAIRLGKLKERATNRAIMWEPSDQAVGLADSVKHYFESTEYNEMVLKHKTIGRFYLDWDSPKSSEAGMS